MSKPFNLAGYTGNVAAPFNLASFTCTNEGASTVWVMLFDSATTPVNGATPNVCLPIKVPAGEPASWDIVPVVPIQSGFYWVASSTQPTLTIAAGATINAVVGF